jgi:hypothetical protein
MQRRQGARPATCLQWHAKAVERYKASKAAQQHVQATLLRVAASDIMRRFQHAYALTKPSLLLQRLHPPSCSRCLLLPMLCSMAMVPHALPMVCFM